MKRTLSLVLALAMVVCVLAACGGSGSAGGSGSSAAETESSAAAFDPAQMKTMGDVFALVGEDSQQEGCSETHYVIVFEKEGVIYRAIAELPQDVSEKIWAIDFEVEDRDQQVKDLVAPLDAKIENLTEQMPSQEELDKYVGKTGQDLFDEGWYEWYYNLEDMEAGMNYGMFSYMVKFEYDGPQMENTDDFDFQANFKDLKISSVTCEGVGDATTVDEE